MGKLLVRRLSRVFEVGETGTAEGRALLEERYQALQRQIPLLYLVILGNVLGLHLASAGKLDPFQESAIAVVFLIIVRLCHWLRQRGSTPPAAKILRELRWTLFFSALFSLVFLYWAISLHALGDAEQQSFVILFASLASVGCAYGLSGFPAAARLPLLLLAFPLSLHLVASPHPAQVGVGVTLMLIVFLTLRLLNLHNHGFTQLVRSRSQIAMERERAQKAEQTALEEKANVRKVADTDPLTGLANRRAFIAELQHWVSTPGQEQFVLALVDLDGFKPINDTFGHATGDAVLVEVAARIVATAGPTALVARMGGDEFALIAPCQEKTTAVELGTKICAALRTPYQVNSREVRISACCGLSIQAQGDGDVSLSLSRADMALYRSKETGRGGTSIFSGEMEQVRQRRVAIERALRDTDVQQKIKLVFQPIFDLSTMQISSFEALARWEHPELGQISPAEFIPITEQINVVEQICERLVAMAAEEAVRWPDAIQLSFNLSAVQLCSTTSADRILAAVQNAGLDPARLQVEVTETALLADFCVARQNLQTLRAAGTRIVLDDFGAGYASISYLREMSFDALKLDGSIVQAASRSTAGFRLLKGVIDLCQALGIPCIAEHIENAEQLELLRKLGCRFGQGFLLSSPVDGAAAAALAATQLFDLPAAGAAA